MNILADVIERVLVRIASMQNADDPDEVAHIILLRFLANNIRIKRHTKAYLNQAVRFVIYTLVRDEHWRWMKAQAYAMKTDVVSDDEAYRNAKLDLDYLITNHRTDLVCLIRYSQTCIGDDKRINRTKAMRLRRRLKATLDY